MRPLCLDHDQQCLERTSRLRRQLLLRHRVQSAHRIVVGLEDVPVHCGRRHAADHAAGGGRDAVRRVRRGRQLVGGVLRLVHGVRGRLHVPRARTSVHVRPVRRARRLQAHVGLPVLLSVLLLARRLEPRGRDRARY